MRDVVECLVIVVEVIDPGILNYRPNNVALLLVDRCIAEGQAGGPFVHHVVDATRIQISQPFADH